MKKQIDIDAMVAEAVPMRPNPQLAFNMPVQVVSEANTREHWGKKFKRKKEQQTALHKAWKVATKKLPRKFVSSTKFQSSQVTSRAGLRTLQPALFTRM